jgi:hypothetical protein
VSGSIRADLLYDLDYAGHMLEGNLECLLYTVNAFSCVAGILQMDILRSGRIVYQQY